MKLHLVDHGPVGPARPGLASGGDDGPLVRLGVERRLEEELRRTREAQRSFEELLALETGTESLDELLAAVTRHLEGLNWVAPNLGASVVLAGREQPSSAFGCPHHDFGVRPPCFDGELVVEEHVHDGEGHRCPAGRTRLRVPIPGDGGALGTVHLCLAEKAFVPEAVRFTEAVARLLATTLRRRRAEQRFLEAQKREALGRLASGIAHDFNNLLAVILSTGELAYRELPDGSPAKEDLADILDAARRGAALTKKLLAFGRPGSDAPAGPIDPGEVLAGLEPLLRRTLGSRYRLEVRRDPEVGQVRIDPGHLEQLLMNLAVNARDAMPDGGLLGIELAREPGPDGTPEGGKVRLSVADTGSGIPPEVLPRIFEPHFTTKGDRGTGLGLATIAGIVRQAGGTIDVASEPGVGTRFEIRLPVAG